MTEQDRKDSANVALLLEHDIINRVGDAMMKLISGNEELHIGSLAFNPSEGGLDLQVARANIIDCLMESMKVQLEQLIRQEIVDAFSTGYGVPDTVGYAQSIKL